MSTDPQAQAPDARRGAEALRRADASMRRVRRLGIGFVLLQFGLYRAPPEIAIPFARWPVALLIAGVLLAVDLPSARLAPRLGAVALHRLGLVQWALDSAAVLAIVWLFSFDPTSALWALLVIPVLEGALRLQMRGAMIAWVGLGAGYVLREAWAARTYAYVDFLPESVSYRLGIVLMVAMCAGGLARSLQSQIEAHAAASRTALRRADVLAVVAAAGRRLSSTVDDILSGIVEATLKLGFDAVEFCVLDEGGSSYRVRCSDGMPPAYQRGPHPADVGIAGEAIARRGTVVVPDYTAWSQALPAAQQGGFHMVIAVPVFCGGEIAGVLNAGYVTERRATTDEVDGLELLAAHAGAALEQQRRLTERSTYEARLSHQAYHDGLTGLPNRRLFVERLDEAVLAARWQSTDVAVLAIDFSHFQSVNDSLGHDAGDVLLAALADRLGAHVREGDYLARIGGDEFAVLLQGADVRGRAPRLARRLLDLLHEPHEVQGRQVYLSAGIGIAYGPVAGAPGGELLRRAVLANDHAKELGRDRVAVYRPDMGERPLRRLEMESALRGALERDEFVLHYQPIRAVAGGLQGVEALVRWERDGDLVPPGDFLPTAEETGLIVALGGWVLREAVAQHCRWLAEHEVAVPMFVNVSGQQLQQAGFVDEVERVLRESGMAPKLLVLEITEGGFTRDEGGLGRLVELRELGVRLALDDFGTGWSSLSRLRGLPVDVLKVDRSFVARLPEDQRSEAIVRSVVALAKELGMSVTAEGIEDEAQRAAVTRLGCTALQGYLLGRPQSADAIALLLAEAAGSSSTPPSGTGLGGHGPGGLVKGTLVRGAATLH